MSAVAAAPPLFAHCGDDADRWKTFYTVACLCHPGQGGQQADMDELCEQARRALGDAWPPAWHARNLNLFDAFCKMEDRRNPFGEDGIAMASPLPPAAPGDPQPYVAAEQPPVAVVTELDDVRGYRYGTAAYAPLAPAVGNVELVFCAAAGASIAS